MHVERRVVFWILAFAVVIVMVGLLRDVLLPFVLGLVLAYFLNPVADRLASMGLGRTGASVLIVLILAIVLVTMAVFLLPMLVSQAQQLALALPGEAERLHASIDVWAREQLGARYPEFQAALGNALKGLTDNWANLASFVASEILSRGAAVFSLVSLILVTPLVMFYMLIDWQPMLAKIDSWLPRDQAPVIRSVAHDVDQSVSAFIRGQGTVCLLLSIYYALALSAIGLKYGLLVGIATGLLSFIPFVGWALGFITSSVLAIMQFWPDVMPLLMVVGVYLLAQAMDAGFLSPKIVGSKIGLHPVWLILALFVFSYLFGFMGMLVAVPVAAALAVLVRFALSVYLRSDLYTGRADARPSAVAETGTTS